VKIKTISLAALALVSVVLLAWNAGESHYRSCVARAVAVTEDPQPAPSISEQLDGKAVPNNSARYGEVLGCSRLPF
jgi:hypothetical protein